MSIDLNHLLPPLDINMLNQIQIDLLLSTGSFYQFNFSAHFTNISNNSMIKYDKKIISLLTDNNWLLEFPVTRTNYCETSYESYDTTSVSKLNMGNQSYPYLIWLNKMRFKYSDL